MTSTGLDFGMQSSTSSGMLQRTSGKTANISVGGVGEARRGKDAGPEAAAGGSGALLDVISSC